MKKYRVNVNGVTYEVEVEEMAGAPQAQPVPAVAQGTVPQPPQPPHVATPVAGETILAPMPGNILDVRVTIGQTVKAGEVLMILEAMKMENEIMCPRDGRVASVNVRKGDTVEPDTVLCVIE